MEELLASNGDTIWSPKEMSFTVFKIRTYITLRSGKKIFLFKFQIHFSEFSFG